MLVYHLKAIGSTVLEKIGAVAFYFSFRVVIVIVVLSFEMLWQRKQV